MLDDCYLTLKGSVLNLRFGGRIVAKIKLKNLAFFKIFEPIIDFGKLLVALHKLGSSVGHSMQLTSKFYAAKLMRKE